MMRYLAFAVLRFIPSKCDGERILKIGPYLTKLREKFDGVRLLTHGLY